MVTNTDNDGLNQVTYGVDNDGLNQVTYGVAEPVVSLPENPSTDGTGVPVTPSGTPTLPGGSGY